MNRPVYRSINKSISALFFCLITLAQGAFSQGQLAQDVHWVATWGTSPLLAVASLPTWIQPPPADQLPADPPPSPIPPVPAVLNDETVRMVVRTSIGGDGLRLQFSNAQGLDPVILGAVHIASHSGNGAIEPASDRAVTFSGKPSVTLRPGALVISDPVELKTEALEELAVSVYLPLPTATDTRHELGLNTTYIVPGNAVVDPGPTSNNSNRSYFWLTGIETIAPTYSATIVAFGDSITDGYATTADSHRAWPALLANRLQDNPATANLGVINMGISGNRVLRNNIGTSALARFDRDVLARSGVAWVILMEGINDITWSALPGAPVSEQASADAVIEGLSQLVDRAHAHGIKVMGATMTPMEGLWLFNEETEAMRLAVNEWIRTSGKYDAVVDFDAVTRDPQRPSQLRPAQDSGDHIHPNDAGNAAMADAIDITEFLR